MEFPAIVLLRDIQVSSHARLRRPRLDASGAPQPPVRVVGPGNDVADRPGPGGIAGLHGLTSPSTPPTATTRAGIWFDCFVFAERESIAGGGCRARAVSRTSLASHAGWVFTMSGAGAPTG